MDHRSMTTTLLALGLALVGSTAQAQQWGQQPQQNPEGGDWQPQQQQQQQQQQAQQQQGQQQQQQGQWGQQQGWQSGPQNEAPPTRTENTTDPGSSDHQRFIGHMAFGYMGLVNVGVGSPLTPLIAATAPMAPTDVRLPGGTATGVLAGSTNGASGLRNLEAPLIGLRYWFTPSLGLDLGLGFAFSSTSKDSGNPGGSTTDTDENGFAIALHGGLPISLYAGKHYSFQVVPELNFAYGTYNILGAVADADQLLTGVTFALGGRIGAEIHFGFIDIPELALQASVGLHLSVYSGHWDTQLGDVYANTSQFGLATTLQGNPWNIFIANLTALYYL